MSVFKHLARSTFIFLVILSMIFFLYDTAIACSVSGYFKNAVNFELVYLSDAIVLAKALSLGKKEGTVKFQVLEVLKGNVREKFLELEGHFDNYLGPSDPADGFMKARPGGAGGSCIARDYRPDKTFLLILRRCKKRVGMDIRWGIYGHAWARVNEEVQGPDDPWLLAVRQYYRLGIISDPEERFIQLKKLTEESTGALKQDLLCYFSIPTADKPLSVLNDFLENKNKDEGSCYETCCGGVPHWAAKAMGLSGNSHAVPILLRCLKNQSPPMESCAEALGNLRAKEAVEPLIKYFLKIDPSSHERQTIANAFGEIGDYRAIPILRAALVNENNTYMAETFATNIFRISGTQNKKIIHPLLWHPLPKVRMAAASGLFQIGDQEALNWLEKRNKVEKDAQVKDNIIWKINNILNPPPLWKSFCY